jgi:hypothetical protein
VLSATPADGGARFVLTSLGRVRVGDGPAAGRCQHLVSPIALTLKGAGSSPDEWRRAVGAVLLTPEAYLAANGKTYAYSPEPEPKLAATASSTGDSDERSLGRRVTVWPKPLFSIEPAISGGGRVQHQGEVDFKLVVGADGRPFRPEVTTPLSDEHTKHVMSVLSLWRFEPAREGDKPVPARYNGRTVFSIY